MNLVAPRQVPGGEGHRYFVGTRRFSSANQFEHDVHLGRRPAAQRGVGGQQADEPAIRQDVVRPSADGRGPRLRYSRRSDRSSKVTVD
jgi:hypothetical protein